MPPHPGHSQIEILVLWKVTLHEKSTKCCTSDYRDFNSMPRKPRRDLLLSVFLGPLGDPVPEPNFPPSNVRSLATSLVHVQALLLPPPSGKDGVLLWWLVHRICSRRARGIVVIFEFVRHNEKSRARLPQRVRCRERASLISLEQESCRKIKARASLTGSSSCLGAAGALTNGRRVRRASKFVGFVFCIAKARNPQVGSCCIGVFKMVFREARQEY